MSVGVSPARASTTNNTTSASSIATAACCAIRPPTAGGVEQPAGVDQRAARAVEIGNAVTSVAGQPGLVRNQCVTPLRQPVEQRRLADVGATYERDHTAHEHAAAAMLDRFDLQGLEVTAVAHAIDDVFGDDTVRTDAVAVEFAAAEETAVALCEHVQEPVVVTDDQIVADRRDRRQAALEQRLLFPRDRRRALIDRRDDALVVDDVDVAVAHARDRRTSTYRAPTARCRRSGRMADYAPLEARRIHRGRRDTGAPSMSTIRSSSERPCGSITR